ncbi:DUF2232 domain-containing protein [Candidatus Hydrogenedentota bacterium]
MLVLLGSVAFGVVALLLYLIAPVFLCPVPFIVATVRRGAGAGLVAAGAALLIFTAGAFHATGELGLVCAGIRGFASFVVMGMLAGLLARNGFSLGRVRLYSAFAAYLILVGPMMRETASIDLVDRGIAEKAWYQESSGEAREKFDEMRRMLWATHVHTMRAASAVAFGYSLLIAACSIGVAGFVLRRSGHGLTPGAPFVELTLPTEAVWLLLLVWIGFLLTLKSTGSRLWLFFLNSLAALFVAYGLQGLAITWFCIRKWMPTPLLKVLAVLMLMLQSWVTVPLILGLGIFDTWFDFRARVG